MAIIEAKLERAVVGALRATIHDHGPITQDLIGSAAKRVLGNLRNAGLVGPADMARGRGSGLAARERRDVAASGGRAAWATMTPAERSAEMKRRAKKRRGPPGE